MSEKQATYGDASSPCKPLTPEQEQLARETFIAALNSPEHVRFEVYRTGRQINVQLLTKGKKRAA